MTQESHQREPSLFLKYHQPVSAPKLGSRVLDWKMAHESAYGYNCFSSAAQSSSSMQGFDASHHGLFELQAGMEMLGIPKAEGNLMEYSTSWQQQNRMLVETQGLSLSLPHHQQNYQQEQQMSMMDARFYPTYQLKDSMYVIPAQELLNEFCNLEGVSNQRERKLKSKEGESSSTPPSWNQSFLFSMDASELQKLKAKLLSMLEEVDTRYKRYCNQMRAVVSTFETVAGKGSAAVYSNLASKAMSRHFRYLRDGIVSQIKATKKAMGEKDPVVPGTTKGETPRLKLLDQCIRQQKSLQQGGAMESHPWRPQRGLPERSVTILRAWLFEHFLHPYPSDVDKHILARQTGLSRSQVSNWFINARVRLWKPMVEEMYLEETKEQDNQQSSQGTPECESNDNNSRPNSILLHSNRNPNPRSSLDQDHDHKPFSSHPRIESDSLTSMINKHQVPIVDLDFSAYNESGSSQNFGNGVSLTLGLQQHTGGGMSLSFSPTNQQTMFFSREQMEDCQPVQFSILDGEGQNLPYRNLMEAQMLHDLAG